MKEQISIVQSDSPFIDKPCTFCTHLIKESDQVVECPRCHTIHHIDCWKNKGGCARQGCPQIAEVVIRDRPQGDGPLPKTPPSYIIGGIAIVITLFLAMFFWPKPPDPAMGRTKIVFMTEGAMEEQHYVEQRVIEYNDSSEDIYIDLQMLPYSAMHQKLVILMAAGDTPDIFSIGEDRLQIFLDQGVFLKLGEEDGIPIYTKQHPSQLSRIGIWSGTENREAALEVLAFLLEALPATDLDALRQQMEQYQNSPGTPFPSTFGF